MIKLIKKIFWNKDCPYFNPFLMGYSAVTTWAFWDPPMFRQYVKNFIFLWAFLQISEWIEKAWNA